jgi:hypothetical protein
VRRAIEYGERPEAFTAATWNSYSVPAERPVTEAVRAGEGECANDVQVAAPATRYWIE